tara:strand:+ start:387 stop:587 length:201 start_codon:yes stop_codon:yes gene_type:complete
MGRDAEIARLRGIQILCKKCTNAYIQNVDPMTEIHLFGTTIDYINEDYSKQIYESKFIYKVDSNLA